MKNFINFRVLLVALFGLMVLGVSEAYAGTGYTHGRAFLKSGSPTAAGKVYVAANATAPTDGQYKNVTSSTSPAFDVKNSSTQTYHFWAKANPGYIFTGWYTYEGALQSSGAAHISKSVTQPQAGTSDAHAYADYYASFIKQIQLSFITPTNGSFDINHNGSDVTPAYSSFTSEGKVVLTAHPADGYKLRGWYTSTNGGATKNYFAFGNSCEPNFTNNVTIGAEFVPDDGKATFWIKGTNKIFNDLNAANTAASSGNIIVVVSDGTVGAGTYSINSGVTLLIPYNETYNLMTTPNVVHYTSAGSAPALSTFRKLTLVSGATINVSGNICIGGSQTAVNGGNPTSQPCGPCGVLDLSRGGTINLESGSVLYAWGFVKGQDMDQGNNTTASGVGVINAASGSTVWEDYQCGEWRGGTASSTIYSNKGSWKFFPFQSYTVQNIEAPVTYAYNSNLKCYWAIFGNGTTYTVNFPLIGTTSAASLFQLATGGTIKKWYDPTTDRVCYEMGGAASLNALSLTVMGESVSSADYNLPIPANMQIILASGTNLTVTKPMTVHAGAVVEIKSGATLKLNSNVYLYDKDDWDMYCMYKYYYRTYKNLTLHYNRGTGQTKDILEDATVIVDGTLDLTGSGRLYATAHGANICGNGGGQVKYGTLPGNTTMVMCKELSDNVSVNIRSANMHNDNGTYTKGIASTTFKNVNGRWFTNAKSTEKANHTYDFTYIKSGDVYGTGGTNGTVAACCSKDKTGLELQNKWANIKKDVCDNWWVGIDDSHLYNWSLNSAWHQYIKAGSSSSGEDEGAVITDIYAGSDGKMLYKTDCDVVEAGTIDGNCLYTVDGVKKALVNGAFVAVTANGGYDHGYHATADASSYYLCFDGCVWHPATRNAENRYTVDGQVYIWYDDKWLGVEYDSGVSLYYSLSATNVKIYYEYVNHEWVLATPVAEVTTSAGTEQVYSLATAVSKAASGGTNVTIRLLKNISGTINYTTGNNCSLDLNGYTLSSSTNNMITVNNASANFIIKDQSAAGTGKVQLSYSANERRYAVCVTKGHVIVNSGTVTAINTKEYVGTATDTKPEAKATTSCVILVKAGQKCTINGGLVEAKATYNPYAIYSDGANSIITVNGGKVRSESTQVSSPYAIISYGTINVNGGEIEAFSKTTSTIAIYVHADTSKQGTLNMTGGTVTATSTTNTVTGILVNRGLAYNSTTAEPRTIKQEYPGVANISGGTIKALTSGSTTAYGFQTYGTLNISGGEVTVKPKTTTAYGVYLYAGTTTISGMAHIDVQATNTAYGVYSGKYQPHAKGGPLYNGTLEMNGGTLDVKTTTGDKSYGVYVGVSSRNVTTTHATDASYFAGNYANAGTATINGGEINVTAKTSTAYALYVEAALSGTFTGNKTPKCTVNGGKFKVVSTDNSTTNVVINNTGATLANFAMAGGYFNAAPNGTTNIAAGKTVKDLDATVEADLIAAGYTKKIAGTEYTVTFKTYNATASKWVTTTIKVESGKVPVYPDGTPIDYASSTTTARFSYWRDITDPNNKVDYRDGLPAVEAANVIYQARYTTLYAQVTWGGNDSIFTNPKKAWNFAITKQQATIKILSNYGTEAAGGTMTQLVFNPTNANSTITFDLNGHSWVMGNNSTASENKNVFLNVAPTKANCKLIITDNSASGNGYLMNKNAYDGVLYCANVANGGELILQGGGLRVSNTSDASAEKYGIGLNVASGGKFTMTGGTLYSTDAYSPRGMNVSSGGTADIAGGTIEANTTTGHAYAILPYGTVSVGGTALIKAVSTNAVAYTAQTQGTLNIDGGTFEATAASNARTLFAYVGGKINVDGNPTIKAEVTSGSEAYPVYSHTTNSEVVINGGSFTSTGISTSGSIMGIRTVSNGVVTVNDGTFTLNGGSNWTFGAFANGGTVNLNGGTFNVNQASGGNVEAVRVYPDGTCNISGGTYTVNATANTTNGNALCAFGGTANITGNPVFTAYKGIDIATSVVTNGDQTATVSVDGGTYITSSYALRSIRTTLADASLTGSITGDLTVWDGKFFSSSTEPVNTGSGESYLKIRGGYYSTYTSSNADNLSAYVVSPSTAVPHDTTIDGRGYTYRVNCKYNVTWSVGGNTTVQEYNRNETPSYGSTPTIDDGNYYVFNGWSPELAPVTADVTYTAQFRKYEAEVYEGENPTPKRFEHFTDAWSAAKNLPVAKVKLLSNVSMSTQLVLTPDSAAGSKPLTLDLNNHTLAYTGTTDRFVIVNKAGCVLKVADSSVANGGVLKYEGSYNGGIYTVVSYSGDIVLESGKIFAKNTYAGKSSRAVTPCATTTFTMTGGTAEAHAPTDARAIAQDGTPSVIVSGGKIIAKSYTISGDTVWGSTSYGICMGHGSLSVSGNPIITSDASASALGVYMYNSDASFEIDGGTFTSKAHNGSASYSIYTNTNSVGNIIRGGTFKAIGLNGGQIHAVHAIGSSKIDISGGTFTSHANADQSHCLFVQSGGTLNVSGGSFTAESDAPSNGNIEAVRMWTGGVVNISGGTFTSTGASNNIALRNLGGTATISGGTFTSGNYTIGVAEAGSIGSVGDVRVNINGGTFISTTNRNIYASTNEGTTSVAVTVNGGYFHSAGTNVVEKAGTATIVLNGGKYNETSGSNHKTNITSYKGSTTTVSDISETVAGKTYVYELLTKFNISWRGGSSYTKDEQIYSGIVPTNNELVGKYFLRNDSAFYFTGWSPTPTAVAGDATYQALGEYHVAKVTVAAKDSIFDDFDEAWNYAMTQTNATITLLNNLTRTESIIYIPENANARHTFDLNNFTIKENTKDRLLVVNKSDAKLTITDNSSEKGGCLYKKMNSSANMYTTVIYHGELILAGGKLYVENTKDDKEWHPALAVHTSVSTDGIFTMTGGTVESQAKYLAYPIYNYATTNISGGTVIANATSGGNALGFYAVAGTATISGGTFNVTASTNAIGAIATGWISADGSNNQQGTLNITGGTFNVSCTTSGAHAVQATGTGKNIGGTYYTSHGIMNVSGGTFNVTCPPVAEATQVFAAQVNAWRQFDDALPHSMVAEAKGEMNISGGTFTVDARDDGAWVANKGNVDLLRNWGTLNVSGGNFTIHQYSTPSAISVFRGKATVTGNPVFNVYAHTGNAYAVCAGYWTHENYCDKNAANNLAEAEVNGGTFKIITEGQNTDVIYALGQISQESHLKSLVNPEVDSISPSTGTYIITAHAGYAMNAKVTVNGGTFLGICPNESGKYPIMLNSRTDQVGTYGTAKSEIYVTGGKFKSRKGTEADNTTTGAVNCHNNVGTLLLTGGYFETNGQLNAQKADTCIVTNITSADIDPEYNNGYRYRVDVDYRVKVTHAAVEKKFVTLNQAFEYAKAQTNPTITLIGDANFTGPYSLNPTVANWRGTLDLNNFTITSLQSASFADRYFTLNRSDMKLTVTDNSGAKGGTWNMVGASVTQSYVIGIVVGLGELELAGGKIYVENNNASQSVTGINTWCSTINKAFYTQTGGTLEAKSAKSATALTIYGATTISGGEVKATTTSGATARAFTLGVHDGIIGSLTVNGSPTITVNSATYDAHGIYSETNGATATISGGTFNITSGTTAAYGVILKTNPSTITISGGTFNTTTSGDNCRGIFIDSGNSTVNVSGGTFNVTTATSGSESWYNIEGIRIYKGASTITCTGGTFNITNHSQTTSAVGARTFAGTVNLSGTVEINATQCFRISDTYISETTANVNISGGTFNSVSSCIYTNKIEGTGANAGKYNSSNFTVTGGKFKTTGANHIDGVTPTSALHLQGGYFTERSGTASKTNLLTYIADTCDLNTLDPLYEGIYKYQIAPHYVAKVVESGGAETYFTLVVSALDFFKTKNNATLTMLDDAELPASPSRYTLIPTISNWRGTWDLNDKTVSCTYVAPGYAMFDLNKADAILTITDNSIAKRGRLEHIESSASAAVWGLNIENGEIILEAGTIYAKNPNADATGSKYGISVKNANSRFTMNGGRIECVGSTNTQGLNLSGGSTATVSGGKILSIAELNGTVGNYAYGIYISGTSTLTVNGADSIYAKAGKADNTRAYSLNAGGGTVTIEGTPFFIAESPTKGARVLQSSGTANVTVNGGTFESKAGTTDSYALIAEGTSTMTVNGGKYKTKQTNITYKSANATLTINGGYYNESSGTAHKNQIATYKGDGKVVLNLDTDDAEYIAGYRYIVTDDPVAKVKAGSEVTYYTTIEAAFDAANSSVTYDPTITLLRDASTNTSLMLSYTGAKNCTLNLNGHTLSSTTAQALLFINKAGITFTITDLTESKSGTLHLESTSTDNRWCVYVANGNLQMDAGTISLHSKANQFNEGVRIDPVASTFTMNGGKVYVVTSDSKTACGIASRGVAVINGGEIQVEASGIGYGIEARVKDTNIGNVTVNGGKFLVTGTTAACAYKSAANATLKLQGGYYNSDTDLSTYCATNYHVLPNDDATYPYKVAEAYTLTWTTDGDALTGDYTSGLVEPGAAITAPNTPTKTGYTFAGWSTTPAATMPAANTTYTATWTINSYTIRFLNYDGSELQSSLVNYGETPVYSGETPSKPADATYTYTFDTWSPAITAVSKAQDYTAQFSQTENVASVTVNSSGYTLYYTDFSKAFKVAKDATVPVTIKLLRDASCSEALQYNSNNTDCTLDLNGHTLTSNTSQSSPLHINKSNATFTITDGTDEKSGKLSMTTTSATTIFGAYVQSGTLLLNAGTIEVLSGSATTCGVTVHNGSFTMEGGTIHVKTTDGREGRGVYAYASSTTITGGTIHVEAAGDGYGIKRDDSGTGTVTVNGGKFNISASGSAYVTNQANNTYVKIYGGYYNINRNLAACVAAPKYVFRTTAADKASVGEDYEYKVTTGYVITYNKGANGTGTIASGTKAHGDDFTLSSSTFTRTGYTQTGWSESDGGAKAYELGGTYAGNADITLYPFWSAQNYTLTLNNQSATTAGTTSITVTYNSNTNLTATPAITLPTKMGYTFGGYYVSQGGVGKQVIADNGNVNASVDGITDASKNWILARGGNIYAKWTQTVTLHDNNGGIHNGSLEVTYNANKKSGTPPTREGYTVEGYYAEPACTNKVLTTAAVWVNYSGWVEDGKWVHDGESTLYTKWIETTHTVTVAAGANGSVSPTSVSGVGITTASGDITATPNTGYHFVNWTLPDGVTAASTYTASSNPIRINATADDLTITANFAIDTYAISYAAGTYGSGSLSGGTKTYGVAYALSSSSSAFTRTGYTYDGWSTVAAGSSKDYTLGGSYTTNAAQTFYPHWVATPYTITYDLDGGSVASPNPTSYTVESAAITLNNPTKTGYTFAGWTGTGLDAATTTVTIAAGSTGNRSYTATWTANTYSVTLDRNSGTSGATSVTMTYNSSTMTGYSKPGRTGYTFGGYYTSESSNNGTGDQVISKDGVLQANVDGYTGAGGVWIRTTATTLYAKWSQNRYYITFTHNGNGTISYNGTAIAAGGTARVYQVAQKALVATPNTGYHFTGWTVTGSNAGKVTIADLSAANTTIVATGGTATTVTVTAGFAPNTNTAYTVKHYKQNLAGDGYDLADTDNLTGTTGASVTPAVKSYTGFTAPSTQTVTILADGSRVVTYNYTRNSYTLTWALDGGSISVAGTTAGSVKYGASLTAPTVTKPGYTFSAWTPTVAATMPAEATTYTATWTEAGLIFTGGASTLWNDPANWTPNCVPTAAHDIIIQKPCSVNVADATAKSIVIAQNGGNTGKLIIGANQALEVTGTITKTTDGSNRLATGVSDLILESAAVGNASLIFDNSNSCQATVEMYSKATYPKGGTATWQYIGIPLAGETNAKSNYYGSWLYRWGANNEEDYGWIVVPNGGSVKPWTGYCITQREATTYEPKGTLVPTNEANLTVPAEKEMVYANSWTAPIQIQQMEAANFTNVEATIYFFNTGLDDDANGGTGTEAGTYRTVPINSDSWIGLPTKISSMQGFYVKNSSASTGTVTWQYADVVRPKNDHSITNGAMFAPKQVSEEDISDTKPDVMKITAIGSRYKTDLYLLAREDFSTGFDNGWDGENINEPSASPLMYALRTDGTKDAVTAIPEMEGTVIGFHAGEDKMYTFTFAYDGEEKLYLNDLQAQTYTLISAESTYSFFANETDEEARFIISGAPFDDTTTGNEHINDQSPIVRKVIIEDHVYIIRGGRIFTIDGGLVR